VRAKTEAELEELRNHQCKDDPEVDYFWDLTDSRGIYLARVCDKCHDVKKSKYNPMIFQPYTQADFDEPIEPEDYY
jgi:hypothetical protein